MHEKHSSWFILPGSMGGDMWHIVASLLLEPKAQLLMEVDPLFYDLYQRTHHGHRGHFKGNQYIGEPVVNDYNIFLEKEGLIEKDGQHAQHPDFFNLAKRLRQHIKTSKKHYQDSVPESFVQEDRTILLYDRLLKYMGSENSTLKLLESSNVGKDRYHLVENSGDITSSKGSFHERAIDAVIAHPKYRNITGYIGTHNAASTIVAKHLQQDVSSTCRTITENMGKVSSKHVINRVHEMVADASKTPDPKGRVLLINMRCAPYNRHQNVTVHIMHQLIERVQNYNKTHDEKLYIRPLGAFTTHNTGSKESIDQIRLADFVTSYTRDNPGAPILPPIDFYGRLATLETTVDTRMTDPSSIMEFWRQASKEPKIAGVIGGRSGSLHIASYAFADPKKILAWDIPYAFNDPRLEHERNSENRHSFRHEDFVRFAMEYPILSIIPISNENKLSFTNDSLTLTDNFLAGRQPQSLTPAELRSYMGTSKNYLPYLRSSPSLQPPEDMKKAAGCVSIIGEDILSFFGKDKSRDREH